MKWLLAFSIPMLLSTSDVLREEDSAEALYNRALVSLGEGALRETEISAERAAARGGREFEVIRDFLNGNTAFVRCLQAEAEAGRPEGGPFALDRAILEAEAAIESWQRAALTREDWPVARRNIERALLVLEKLKRLKEEQEQQKKKEPDQPPTPEIPKPPEETEEKDPDPEKDPDKLSAAQLQELLDRLARKEKEKIELRRAVRTVREAGVERDW